MVVNSSNGPPSPPRSSDDHHSDSYELRSHRAHNMVPQTPPMNEFAYRDPDYYAPQADEYDDETWYPTYRTPPQQIDGSGIQTRSGRSLGTPMTSEGSPSSRTSQSPRTNKRKPARSAKKEYHITEPLSVMTKDYDVPVEDMEVVVNRPDEERIAECAKKPKNTVPRPMNSFMLYRRAYKNRIKQWGKPGDNNQMISSVAGESWHLEPEDVRSYYIRVAKIEAENHARAFPNYKFQPNKDKGRNKRQYHDTDDETASEYDGDSVYSRKRPRATYHREMTRSRSTTPAGIMYDSPQYHHAAHPSANSNPYYMPFPQYEPMYEQQWQHAAPYGQYYGEYPPTYLHQGMPHGQGPRSVPLPQDLSYAAPVALPPSADINSIDPNLGDYVPQYEYGSQIQEGGHSAGQYGEGLEQDLHPGDQTLAPAQSWTAAQQPGNDFDVELDGFHQ